MTSAVAVNGIFELQLVSGQVEAMIAFYRDIIGLTVSLEDHARGRTHLRTGSGQLIIVRADGDRVVPEWPGLPPHMSESEDSVVTGPAMHGPVHFAFEVEQAQCSDVLGRLSAAGRLVRGPLVWPTGHESWYFLDPDGNCCELITTR